MGHLQSPSRWSDGLESVAYEVQCEEDEARLATYETNAYETASCPIELEAQEEGSKAHTISGKTSDMQETPKP